ncbi:MAG: hypothetical protein QXT79_09075 [Thermofilaceae archaeon]
MVGGVDGRRLAFALGAFRTASLALVAVVKAKDALQPAAASEVVLGPVPHRLQGIRRL